MNGSTPEALSPARETWRRTDPCEQFSIGQVVLFFPASTAFEITAVEETGMRDQLLTVKNLKNGNTQKILGRHVWEVKHG